MGCFMDLHFRVSAAKLHLAFDDCRIMIARLGGWGNVVLNAGRDPDSDLMIRDGEYDTM